jgi:type 1 fimbria pilin
MDARPRTIALVAIAVLPLALAGCTDATKLSADAVLEFDGSGSGTHSEKADCGDEVTITGDGTIRDGVVRVTVIDNAGDEAFAESYDKDFTLNSKTLTGPSGDWRIEAERGGDDLVGDDFTGEYTFTLNC